MEARIENILIQFLHNERVEVTYKLLSRKCKIPVNQAKKALQKFYEKSTNSHRLVPIYFLCRNENEYFVGVKPDENGEGNKFVKILHLYALSPSNLETIKQKFTDGIMEDSLYMIDSSVTHSETVDDLQKCRPILHPSMTYSTERKPVVKNESIIVKSNSAPSFGKSNQISLTKTIASKMTKSNSSASVHKTKSFFASKTKPDFKVGSQKESKTDNSSTKHAAKTGSVVVIPENSIRIITSPKESPQKTNESKNETMTKKEIIPVIAASKESIAQSNQIINMFEEDEKMEVTQSLTEVERAPQVSEENFNNHQESKPESSARKILKRRKVIKSETYMEGKYLKTRDVEVWEEYECDEANLEPKRQSRLGEKVAQIASKSTKSNGGKSTGQKIQKSVASFFKKA